MAQFCILKYKILMMIQQVSKILMNVLPFSWNNILFPHSRYDYSIFLDIVLTTNL